MKCEYCSKDPSKVNGCLRSELVINGHIYKRIPYFNEKVEHHDRPTKRCHDCNVLWGQFHHADCDFETCPLCLTQLLSCELFNNHPPRFEDIIRNG